MQHAVLSRSFAFALCAVIACSALAFSPGGVRAAAMSDEDFVRLCVTGTAEEVKQALKDGANPNAKRGDDYGPTALEEATGDAEKVRLLLAAGADAKARGAFGRTALMKAAEIGEEASVRALLSAGADVNAKSEGDPIAQTPAGWTAPMMAARHGHAGVFGLLASAGADLSVKDADGFTMLMAAACGGDVGIVRKALDAGATVDARDSDGMTALMYAALHGEAETARMLLSAGANPRLKDSEGRDALWHARNPETDVDADACVPLLEDGVRAASGGPPVFGFDGVPLGAFIDGAWAQYPDVDDDTLLRGGKLCRVYGFYGLETDSAVIVPDDEAMRPREEWEDPPRYTLSARTGTGAVVGEGSARLVVVGDHDAMPRTPQVLPTGNALYQKIVSEYLAGRGLAVARPNIVQLLRVDLEGDGTDEVLITAQNAVSAQGDGYSFAPGKRLMDKLRFVEELPRARAGQYSVVLLRRVVGGEARNIPLLDDFIATETPPRDPNDPHDFRGKIMLHKIDAIADLNGDGVMEIITTLSSAYAFTYTVHEIRGDRVGEVANGGYTYED